MQTLTQSINFSKTFIDYSPLTAGTGFNPAATIGTMVRNTILNAPFTWGWNRKEDRSLTTAIGTTQDYTIALTDFGWLEKISLIPPSGNIIEIKDIYNTAALGVSNTIQRPNAVSVNAVNYGTSVQLRFMGMPDVAYNVAVTYQVLPISFQSFSISSVATASGGNTIYTGVFTTSSFPTGSIALVSGFAQAGNNGEFSVVSVTGTTLTLVNSGGLIETAAASVVNESWAPIPDSFVDVFNTLFLGEAFQAVDDARGAQYRQRGAISLLSKAEGLTQMQKSAFLSQYLSRDAQTLSEQIKTQQGNQGRGV